jgi:PAP2 superfamily
MRLHSAAGRAKARVMKSRPLRIVAVLGSLVVALSGVSAPVHAQAANNAVTDWNLIAVNTLVVFPGPAGGAPPALQVNLAMVQGAVYDAVNATELRPRRPYLLEGRFAPTASKEAAAATAAYSVLTSIVSSVPASIPFPNRADLVLALDREYETSLAAIPEGPSKTEGIAAGDAAADAMMAAREDDGRFEPSPWKPRDDPGHWQPLLNPDGTQSLDPTPWVGGVRPFLIESASQFRTEGPQALTSEAWAKDFDEVKALGSVNSTARTPEQTHIALWWQGDGGPTVMWNGVARDLVNNGSYGVDIAHSALLFAQLNLSGADAAITCWNDKYYWGFWRPWTAIHEADRDGNPATEPDPSWTPLITAPYPEQPSGHLSLDAAHLRVLQMFFGSDEVAFDVTSSRFDRETRHFDRFSQPLEEIIEARIWAGLHYRTADVQARVLGGSIVDYMTENYFQTED